MKTYKDVKVGDSLYILYMTIKMCTDKIEHIDAMVEISKYSRKHYMKELERWIQITAS